jgi:predicted transcriptional regulator YheO
VILVTTKAADELKRFIPTVDAIAHTFGKNCEVILHDLTNPQSSVMYVVNGHVTGREVGHSFNHLITRVLLSNKFQNDFVANFKTETEDKRLIKSTSALIRNSSDEVIGSICINFDLTPIEVLKDYIVDFSPFEQEPVQKNVEQYDSVMEIVDKLIDRMIDKEKVDQMDRNQKLQLVKFMNDKGVFLIKGLVEKVADMLNVSKVTMYSYLDDVKKQIVE